MGTNFYIKGQRDEDNPDFHLGKRAAAGYYCWDCNVTLCENGNEAIHMGRSDWLDACPWCFKPKEEEKLEAGSAGRELGFNKEPPKRKTGVKSCSSFSWAMTKDAFARLKDLEQPSIEDEYSRPYTFDEFLGVLEECPIQLYHSVGIYFS